jgi:hypothetical protein
VKSDVAGGYVVLMAANVRYKVRENAGTMIFGNEAEGKRHGIGGLAALIVDIGFRVKKVCVDRCLDGCSSAGDLGSVSGLVEDGGNAREIGEVLVVNRCRSHASASEL